MNRYARFLLLALAALASASFAQSRTSEYPDRPVRVIAASTPGASIDISARLFASWMQARLKQPFLVENRPGAGGVIGTEAVAKAAPDGYTLLAYASGMHTQPLLFKNVPYDWTRDITPIAITAGSGYAVTISSTIPPKTLAELIAYAKANPGKLHQGLSGSVSPDFEDVKDKLGLGDVVNVMYKGGAQAAAAINVGEVQLMQAGVYQAIPMVQSGRARILGYTGTQRHFAIPDVPTLAELGFPGVTAGFWLGIFGPGGLPAEITSKLSREIQEMNRAPETLERYKGLGYDAYHVTPEQMRAQMLADSKTATAIFKRLGITPQ
jgi:tripartite-type tricarboxylate transporter receptor subunit TctC